MTQPGNDQIREAALDGVQGASKPLANSAQNREGHIGGHLSGDGPIDPAAAPTGPAPGAQIREGTVEGGRRLHEAAGLLKQIEMTAEVWPHGGDGDDIDQATVVDVVRIDNRLHFVVVLDD